MAISGQLAVDRTLTVSLYSFRAESLAFLLSFSISLDECCMRPALESRDDSPTYLRTWRSGASEMFHWSDQANSLAVAKLSQNL
jgi:hypothetical protein